MCSPQGICANNVSMLVPVHHWLWFCGEQVLCWQVHFLCPTSSHLEQIHLPTLFGSQNPTWQQCKSSPFPKAHDRLPYSILTMWCLPLKTAGSVPWQLMLNELKVSGNKTGKNKKIKQTQTLCYPAFVEKALMDFLLLHFLMPTYIGIATPSLVPPCKYTLVQSNPVSPSQTVNNEICVRTQEGCDKLILEIIFMIRLKNKGTLNA